MPFDSPQFLHLRRFLTDSHHVPFSLHTPSRMRSRPSKYLEANATTDPFALWSGYASLRHIALLCTIYHVRVRCYRDGRSSPKPPFALSSKARKLQLGCYTLFPNLDGPLYAHRRGGCPRRYQYSGRFHIYPVVQLYLAHLFDFAPTTAL